MTKTIVSNNLVIHDVKTSEPINSDSITSKANINLNGSSDTLNYQSLDSHELNTKSNPNEYFIRLRGVPWKVKLVDIINFISPVCEISSSDVFIIANANGTPTGDVFVKVKSLQLRDDCIEKLYGKYIGYRWIEIFVASPEDIIQFSLNHTENFEREKNNILYLRGLPWMCSVHDIIEFFKDGDFHIFAESIFIGSSLDHSQSGEAWVIMNSLETAEKARESLHKRNIGKRYIEIFFASSKDCYLIQKHQQNSLNKKRNNRLEPYNIIKHKRNFKNQHIDRSRLNHPVLRIRGLPYNADQNHILDFFNGYRIVCILPVSLDSSNALSGEAFVEFSNKGEASRALMERNGAMIQHRYIEIFPATRYEFNAAKASLQTRGYCFTDTQK